MRIFLVQHGNPVSDEVDPARPLSEKGKHDVKKVKKFLLDAGVDVCAAILLSHLVIVHSGKLRAKQTAEIIAENESLLVEKESELAPMSNPRLVADEIRELVRQEEERMYVGHLPHLGRLSSLLISEGEGLPIRFQQGGVVCLEPSEAGKWAMSWYIVPSLLQ